MNRPEQRRTRPDVNIAAQGGSARFLRVGVEPLTERHVVKQNAALADHRAVAEHQPRTVNDRDAITQRGLVFAMSGRREEDEMGEGEGVPPEQG